VLDLTKGIPYHYRKSSSKYLFSQIEAEYFMYELDRSDKASTSGLFDSNNNGQWSKSREIYGPSRYTDVSL